MIYYLILYFKLKLIYYLSIKNYCYLFNFKSAIDLHHYFNKFFPLMSYILFFQYIFYFI